VNIWLLILSGLVSIFISKWDIFQESITSSQETNIFIGNNMGKYHLLSVPKYYLLSIVNIIYYLYLNIIYYLYLNMWYQLTYHILYNNLKWLQIVERYIYNLIDYL
jgi:hypothetical protein